MEEQTDESDRLKELTDEIHGLLQEVLVAIVEGNGLRELSKAMAMGVAMAEKPIRHLQAVKDKNE